jgi:hypothetical protein
MTPLILAISDSWTVTMFMGNLVVGTLVTVVGILITILLFREKQRDEQIRLLKHNLESRTDQLIESKLAGVAVELEGVIKLFNERIKNIRERLTAGDGDFDDLNKRDHELEARFNIRFDQLKDWLHANFATKADTQALHHRIDRIKYPTAPAPAHGVNNDGL